MSGVLAPARSVGLAVRARESFSGASRRDLLHFFFPLFSYCSLLLLQILWLGFFSILLITA
jgi:hypothetical protein